MSRLIFRYFSEVIDSPRKTNMSLDKRLDSCTVSLNIHQTAACVPQGFADEASKVQIGFKWTSGSLTNTQPTHGDF